MSYADTLLHDLVEHTPKAKPHVTNNSGNNEHYTPEVYVEAVREVMGDIDCDPASCAAANARVKARVIYTKETNGLLPGNPWGPRVFMNPPYSRDLYLQFIDALLERMDIGQVTEAITLTNNTTETVAGQRLLSNGNAVCFPRKRIKFIGADGKPGGSPLQAQMFVYFGPNVQKFLDVFAEFGTVLRCE